MTTPLKITAALSACILLAGPISGYAQEETATKEVGKAIRQYYEAMSTRNVVALRGVLDATFIVVEAGRENAKVHVISSAETSKLLPPEGNDDWQNVQVTDLMVRLSSTHSSVATVSYRVFHPLAPDNIKALEDALKAPGSPLDDARRRDISKRVADKGHKESECAMLALRDGKWRIVSISVPK